MYIDLLQIQRSSFLKFLQNGINQVFDNINPIIIANRKYIFFSKYYLLKIPSQIHFVSIDNQFQPNFEANTTVHSGTGIGRKWRHQKLDNPRELVATMDMPFSLTKSKSTGKIPRESFSHRAYLNSAPFLEPLCLAKWLRRVGELPFCVDTKRQRTVQLKKNLFSTINRNPDNFFAQGKQSTGLGKMVKMDSLTAAGTKNSLFLSPLASQMRPHFYKGVQIPLPEFSIMPINNYMGKKRRRLKSQLYVYDWWYNKASSLVSETAKMFKNPRIFSTIDRKLVWKWLSLNHKTSKINNKTEIEKPREMGPYYAKHYTFHSQIPISHHHFAKWRRKKLFIADSQKPSLSPNRGFPSTSFKVLHPRFADNDIVLRESNYKRIPQMNLPINKEIREGTGLTYSSEFYIPVQIVDQISKKMYLRWLLLADLPIQTKRGHFIINGYPKTVIHQIVRSPGIRFKNEDNQILADIISMRGAWMGIQIQYEKNLKAATFDTKRQPVRTFPKNDSQLDTIYNSILHRSMMYGESPTINEWKSKFSIPARMPLEILNRAKRGDRSLFRYPENSNYECEKIHEALFINFFISPSRSDKGEKKKIKLSGFAFLNYLFDHPYFVYNNYVAAGPRSSFFPAHTKGVFYLPQIRQMIRPSLSEKKPSPSSKSKTLLESPLANFLKGEKISRPPSPKSFASTPYIRVPLSILPWSRTQSLKNVEMKQERVSLGSSAYNSTLFNSFKENKMVYDKIPPLMGRDLYGIPSRNALKQVAKENNPGSIFFQHHQKSARVFSYATCFVSSLGLRGSSSMAHLIVSVPQQGGKWPFLSAFPKKIENYTIGTGKRLLTSMQNFETSMPFFRSLLVKENYPPYFTTNDSLLKTLTVRFFKKKGPVKPEQLGGLPPFHFMSNPVRYNAQGAIIQRSGHHFGLFSKKTVKPMPTGKTLLSLNIDSAPKVNAAKEEPGFPVLRTHFISALGVKIKVESPLAGTIPHFNPQGVPSFMKSIETRSANINRPYLVGTKNNQIINGSKRGRGFGFFPTEENQVTRKMGSLPYLYTESYQTIPANRLLGSLISILNTTNFRDVIFERFMNAKFYDIGLMGRKRLNKKLRLNVPLQCTSASW